MKTFLKFPYRRKNRRTDDFVLDVEELTFLIIQW